MKNLMLPRQASVLQDCLESHPLLAFDYDGTLSPIVTNPRAAGMRPRTKKLLTRLARIHPCAVVSGRMRSDLKQKLKGIPLRYLIGNHGVEWEQKKTTNKSSGKEIREERLVSSWEPILTEHLHQFEGVWLEKKNLSITLHYREAVQPLKAKRAIQKVIRLLRGVRVIGGKLVFNLVPREAMNKGEAVLKLISQEGFGGAFYIGDDLTDEDVFKVAKKGRRRLVLGVRIGANATSRAEFFIKDQAQIDALLIKLVAFYTKKSESAPAGVRTAGR